MDDKLPLVSVVVPIYNSKPYLEDCLYSIASQNYNNIEVILINDGSKDDSGNFAKLFCDSQYEPSKIVCLILDILNDSSNYKHPVKIEEMKDKAKLNFTGVTL